MAPKSRRLVALALGTPSLRDAVLFPALPPAAPDAHERPPHGSG